jgi:hypothetical protein
MVNELAVQITAVLETGDFEGAEPLLANFFSSLKTNLAQIPSMQDRAANLQDALGWMHRWLSLSRVMRSHLNEQLRMNIRDASYGSAPETLSTVDFTA